MKKYEYMPEDFKDMGGLDEDLREFYYLLEKYKADRTGLNKVILENQHEDLFFSLKHRALEGFITDELWWEINDYVGGLVSD